jgi:hypothetical protein
MAITGLEGPFSLTKNEIDRVITRVSPGAYALGNSEGNTFYVNYVGRSDDDLNGRLKDHVGKYQQFKAGYFPTAKAAFEKECNLFHDFGEYSLDNKVHPARPALSYWKCPRCNVFG